MVGDRKCHGTVEEVKKIVKFLNSAGEIPPQSEVVIAVPSIHLSFCIEHLRDDIAVAAQNVAVHNGVGAYTGEISAELFHDFGVPWTIVGHSERRMGFEMNGESNELVAKKVFAALRGGLKVIVCVGENSVQRENGETMTICAAQLSAIAALLRDSDWQNLVIAYEPVWAIGTGKVATPQQAEETHAKIRKWVADHVSVPVSSALRIIYGGSVKSSNCQALIKAPNIDGFLVGGASLLPEFADIIRVTK
eukprot:scaffold620_cov177-Ochromonas_danica.AAC.14